MELNAELIIPLQNRKAVDDHRAKYTNMEHALVQVPMDEAETKLLQSLCLYVRQALFGHKADERMVEAPTEMSSKVVEGLKKEIQTSLNQSFPHLHRHLTLLCNVMIEIDEIGGPEVCRWIHTVPNMRGDITGTGNVAVSPLSRFQCPASVSDAVLKKIEANMSTVQERGLSSKVLAVKNELLEYKRLRDEE